VSLGPRTYLTLLGAGAALVVTLLLPKTYEATATILVTHSSYQSQS